MAKAKGRAVPRRKLKVVDAVVYLRVARKATQAARSITAQLDACQEYARENGMNISQTFRDNVDAGEPLENRPALLEAMDSVWGDDVLLVASYDRLASGDCLLRAQVEAALLRKGAQLISTVAEPQGTATAKDIPLARLMQMLREYEACILGPQTKPKAKATTTMKPQTKSSESAEPAPCLINGFAPYGYETDTSQCEACNRWLFGGHLTHVHVMRRNAAQLEVVERILLEKHRGNSMQMIAAILNNEGIPGPFGDLWTEKTVVLAPQHARYAEQYMQDSRIRNP